MEDYYGAPTSSETKPLRERLRDYYQESDFVTVKNTDTQPLTYQFMSPDSQQFIQNAPYHGETHNTKNPQRVRMQSGDTKLCPAYEADLMLENLIKQVSHSRTVKKIKDGQLTEQTASTNWTDPDTQVAIIKEAFLGKQDLVKQFNESSEKDRDEAKEPARVGRPAKTA